MIWGIINLLFSELSILQLFYDSLPKQWEKDSLSGTILTLAKSFTLPTSHEIEVLFVCFLYRLDGCFNVRTWFIVDQIINCRAWSKLPSIIITVDILWRLLITFTSQISGFLEWSTHWAFWLVKNSNEY